MDEQEDLDYDIDVPCTSTDERVTSKVEKEPVPVEEIVTAKDASPAAPEKSAKPEAKGLWVGNITNATKAAELKELFTQYGKVVSASIVMRKGSNQGLFGYLCMNSHEDAQNCIDKLQSHDWKGNKLSLELTLRDPPRSENKDLETKPRQDKVPVRKRNVAKPQASNTTTTTSQSQFNKARLSSTMKAKQILLAKRKFVPRPPPLMNPRHDVRQVIERLGFISCFHFKRLRAEKLHRPRSPSPPRAPRPQHRRMRSPPPRSKIVPGASLLSKRSPILKRSRSPPHHHHHHAPPSHFRQERNFYRPERNRSPFPHYQQQQQAGPPMQPSWEDSRSRPYPAPQRQAPPPRRSDHSVSYSRPSSSSNGRRSLVNEREHDRARPFAYPAAPPPPPPPSRYQPSNPRR
ncbi:hypothetical protein Ciccas_009125 [Cichlidogyrus casuarinus]|uniref:RRM domain-containing protein n=1 Tax=Cichlidogyrus casuarinus TaxID=1844966 RepID=A0ABD2PZL6_9PLAT